MSSGFCLIGVSVVGLISSADAIITEADLDDHGMIHPTRAPMLENVGQLGTRSGSAVYLGKRWILTANHAFVGRQGDVAYFAGKEYQVLPQTAVRLKNLSGQGKGKNTDLLMVQLATDPNLPELKIDEHSPFMDEKVIMIGCGETEPVMPDDSLLTGSGAGVEFQAISGDSVEGVASPRWGENQIALRGLNIGLVDEPGSTQAFVTVKEENHRWRRTQGASGDSGGGVFVKRGDKWKLSGIMLSVLHREDLGQGATFSADLSTYRAQIESTIIPEPSALGLLFLTSLVVFGRRSR